MRGWRAFEQLAADADREIHDEHELLDFDADLDDIQAELDVHAAEQVDAGSADVRDTGTAHPSEDTDTPRGRISAAVQPAADIARAQLALAEIAARNQADAARATEEAALQDDLGRGPTYAEDDVDAADREDELVDNY